MRRWRKDYRLDSQAVVLTGIEPHALLVRFSSDGVEQVFDFAEFAGRGDMAAALALALRMHGADKSPQTCGALFTSGVRPWFRFLDEYDPERQLVVGRDIDTAMVRAFIRWLDGRPTKIGAKYSVWSATRGLLRWLIHWRPDLVSSALLLPYNAFPRKNALTAPREALDQSALDAVLDACRHEIDAVWSQFERGAEALSRADRTAVAAADLKDLNLDDVGVLMAVITDRFGGVIPTIKRASHDAGETMWRVHRALARHGGAPAFSRYLYPTARTLIPFVIAIGAQTFANPDSLVAFTRDCVEEHPLFDNRAIVVWRKGRTSKRQRRSFLRDKSLSPPALIEKVLAFTERLIPHVPERERNCLFLYGSVRGSRRMGALYVNLCAQQVHRFIADHSLTSADGKPLALNLAALRTTGLARAHAALGYDLVKTQALANHASLDTTRRYVDRPLARQGQARELARLQGVFVDWVRGDAPEIKRSLRASRETSADIAAGRNATASGFICRDPLAGVGPEQTPGRLCTAWLGCFTCTNAVIPLDEATLARLIATRAALVNARERMAPERFALIYEPKLAILERDILPRFPQLMHADAAERAAAVALAPIE